MGLTRKRNTAVTGEGTWAMATRTQPQRLWPQQALIWEASEPYPWTGCFGDSTTGTPTLGEIPGHPGCYAVLGYGGNGITFSILAANLLTAPRQT